ncbi:tetratricopeptide repeat protein [Xanthocytophaga agilis]|uniref:Tetratricopeptide repeat protein n=1 Tax=Xanthocytophaga agilis TaxID=3048010 RepID=A0AAE3R3S1_9BACT|nr:tetratricopeptide repeat protein [Xanthocytophaga agilis]MDJ1502625.1 tetratricopeptide repeat protein [Xanthocytophaga agilis]
MKKQVLLTLTFAVLSVLMCWGQQQDIKLADEYLQQNDPEKAREIYRKLIKEEKVISVIQRKYVQTLQKLQAWDEAEKFLKKQAKSSSEHPIYKAELAVIQDLQGKKDEAQKSVNRLIDDIKKNPQQIHQIAQYLLENQHPDWTEKMYLEGRKSSGNPSEYAFQLAHLYKNSGETEKMLDEYVSIAAEAHDNLVVVQNAMQDDLEKPEDFEKLEKVLLAKLQKEPNQIVYNDLLIWFYMQQKDFHRAFLQARAIDRRMKMEGQRLMEIGQISLQNKDYKAASEIFEYLVKEYPQSNNYPMARRYLVNAKEELVKNAYPVNKDAIRSLIADYKILLSELGRSPKTIEAMRSTALLYGFYLNEKDTAITLLQDAIKIARADQRFIDKCKLDLGDIYLLKSEPWEATLIYSQVEKDEKDSPLGYDAKLRNARLNYFKGDFQLAQEHLDILKLATSREIANDAMSLSILIQDNIGLDSTGEAMREYANIELLLFQNRDEESLEKLNQMMTKYAGHSLADEILWQQAQIYMKRGNSEAAVEKLQKIVTEYGYDILSDDADFLIAKLKEEKLGKKEEAMEMYKNFLVKYPGSIYVVEARKRYRNLRGDTPQ